AAAEVYGVDFDFSFNPRAIDGLTIGGAVNWNHARFTDFPNAQCYSGQSIPQGCNDNLNTATGRYTAQDLTGNPLIRAPEWQINGTIDYELPVSDKNVVRLGVAAQYTSKYLTALARPDYFYQPAYATVDANIAFADSDDKWEIALIGRNLSNKVT